MPPECLICVARPAGAAPRPAASRRLMSAPLRVDEVIRMIKLVERAGITPLVDKCPLLLAQPERGRVQTSTAEREPFKVCRASVAAVIHHS